MGKRKSSRNLQVCHPDAAGVDVGSRQHYVAVPDDRDDQPVRAFGTTTTELARLAEWLKGCGIATVALESTGVYWIPLYEILEDRGFEVLLVNAAHVRNVPGRKTDVRDCQWIQQLHSYGLLRASFRPTKSIVELRTYMRQRETLVSSAAREIQHMQKALMLMNVQLHHVVNDITGKTGMRILRALASGDYDPERLAKHRDPRCRASESEIVDALRGNYQREHVFVLQQALSLYDAIHQQLALCDQQIERTLASLADSAPEPERDLPPAKSRRRTSPNEPNLEIRSPLHRICGGADLTQIKSIAPLTALNVLSEIGTDMSRWPTEKHFCSWANLAPGSRITGGKRISGRRPQAKNRFGLILRQAAVSLGKTATALGAFYRRLAARAGKGKAIVATARKLACLIYRLLKYGGDYHELGSQEAEQAYNQRRLSALRKQAKTLGFELSPLPAGG